jgi:hypothetical protein
MYWVTTGDTRSPAFTDLRADATLFGEYRLSDSFGINSTLRYTANFSSHQIPYADQGPNPPAPTAGPGFVDMSWTRFEAFLGARWFL